MPGTDPKLKTAEKAEILEKLPEGFLAKRRRIHFIGIGGSGMSGIAQISLNLGFQVSGSDLLASETTRELEKLGAVISLGHHRKNVNGAELVVYSSAVSPSNPELADARERAVPTIPRAEMLAEIIRRVGRSIIVAGAHGKTTTTSLIGTVFSAAGLDPTVVVGGKLNSLGTGARLGKGGIIVAESDESDGSFLRFFPSVAVVTNIDFEHLNHYGSMASLEAAFAQFLRQVDKDGLVVAFKEDLRLMRIVRQIKRGGRRVKTYGFRPEADWSARNIEAQGMGMEFDAYREGKFQGRVRVGTPGRHNVLNSLAVLAVGEEFKVPLPETARALADFTGVQRRFQVYGEPGGILVVDDYGHHPTEIRATLRAAREGFDRRLVVAFQPHRYTRTRDLYREFSAAFFDADILVLTEIYPASEKPIPGVTGKWLAEEIKKAGHPGVVYVREVDQLVPRLKKILKPGDLLLTLGAGSIYRVAQKIAAELQEG